MKKIIILLISISILLSGCVITDPEDTPTNTPDKEISSTPTKTPEPTQEPEEEVDLSKDESKKYGVGETVDIKGVSVTLESIEKSYGDRDEEFSFNAPGEGKVFVICNFFAENGSDEDFNISSFYFQAYEDGFSIDENYFTGAEGLSGTASPGKKIKGALVYEVSEQFEELELEYEPSFWSDAKITFLITNE